MSNINGSSDSNSYGLAIGFIYIFNLIVGTGALTMPKAFELSGVILSSVMLVILTIISFITVTFMFEAMSIANAIKKFTDDENRTIRYVYSNQAINELNNDEPDLSSSTHDNQLRIHSSVIDEVLNEEQSQVALSKKKIVLRIFFSGFIWWLSFSLKRIESNLERKAIK